VLRVHERASLAMDQKEGLRRSSARRWHFLLPINYRRGFG